MRISHTAIAIDGTTAWWIVDDEDHLPQMWERPCDTCDGIGSQCLNGHDHADCPWTSQCRDCGGTGRHTFTLDVQCGDSIHLPFVPDLTDDDPLYVPGDRECSQCDESGTRTITVHVVDVLELVESGWFYTVATRGGFSKPTTLPTSGAPGKYAVRLEVHA
jgi:hypothetical protein